MTRLRLRGFAYRQPTRFFAVNGPAFGLGGVSSVPRACSRFVGRRECLSRASPRLIRWLGAGTFTNRRGIGRLQNGASTRRRGTCRLHSGSFTNRRGVCRLPKGAFTSQRAVCRFRIAAFTNRRGVGRLHIAAPGRQCAAYRLGFCFRECDCGRKWRVSTPSGPDCASQYQVAPRM